jgi:hypothetical protein
MGKQDKRASNAAKFSVAFSKNAATKILLPAAMVMSNPITRLFGSKSAVKQANSRLQTLKRMLLRRSMRPQALLMLSPRQSTLLLLQKRPLWLLILIQSRFHRQ